ncbi:MAG: hypothetical protein GY795_23190 [Desulfobacterales bacterium]|nr:hypothetical protein [Desulfobacterales bacterium]
MLVTVQNYKSDEYPRRLVFGFEKFSFRRRIEYLDQKIHNSFNAAKNIFEHKYFPKTGHNKIFKKILKGDNVFALLPPDSEESFCLWAPALSEPGFIIVISPLYALIRSRDTPLSINFRFHSGAFITGAKDEKRKAICAEIELGETGILYIDPESLKIQSFRDELRSIISHEPVHSLVIDNAHSISEWGYDFRPSYLRIPDLVSDLKKSNSKLTMIALTTAAGNIVKQDIMNLLDLKEEIIKPGRNFREFRRFDNFRTLRSQLAGPGDNKENDQEKVIFKIVPEALAGISQKIPIVKEETGIRGDTLQTRVIQMPGNLCEQDMQKRKTGIPLCSEMFCEFGRKDLCDYGKQHIIISENFQNAVTEARETLHTLDHLISSFNANDDPVQISASFAGRRNIESALHRLSIIGVIDDFFITHVKGNTVFEVSGLTKSVDDKEALSSLLYYLKKNDMSSGKKYSEYTIEQLAGNKGDIVRCREEYGQEIRKIIKHDAENEIIVNYYSHHTLFNKVLDYLLVMLYCIYEEVRIMRYRMLWNLKELINSRACRNAMLLKNFQTIGENWNCGFCEICVSDPKQVKTAQFPSRDRKKLGKLEKQFKDWLENDNAEFDFEVADNFIEEFSDYPLNIYIRSNKVLEYSPRNIKALYLAYRFSPGKIKGKNAIDLIRIANMDMELLQVKKLYDIAEDNIDIKASQFDIIDDEYGTFNCLEGERWLFNEAGKISADMSMKEMLGARVVVNRLLQTDFSSFRSRLKELSE